MTVDILRVDSLSRSFGGLRAVNNVSFGVKSGEIRSLIGPNGAGKTTLFNVISGKLAPSSGTVNLQGKDVTGWTPERLVGSGLVRTFQITSIFPGLPVFENVALAVRSRLNLNYSLWAPQTNRSDIEPFVLDLLAAVGIGETRSAFAKELSYGERRIVEIAIGLALRPRIILLDEPAAGLGKADRVRMMGLISKLSRQQGVTVLLVEHDIELVMGISDRISVLHHGEMLAEGTPGEIRQSQSVKDSYLGS